MEVGQLVYFLKHVEHGVQIWEIDMGELTRLDDATAIVLHGVDEKGMPQTHLTPRGYVYATRAEAEARLAELNRLTP